MPSLGSADNWLRDVQSRNPHMLYTYEPQYANGPLEAQVQWVSVDGEIYRADTIPVYAGETLAEYRARAMYTMFGGIKPKHMPGCLDGSERILFGSEGFRRKLAAALTVIRTALSLSRRQHYVAFSGGKDSLAVAALVRKVEVLDGLPGKGIPLVWSDDELEYPEHVAYMRKWYTGDNLVVTLGRSEHAGWFKPWTQEPYWRQPFDGALHIEERSEDYWATEGYDLTFTGLRADESSRRRDHLIGVAAGLNRGELPGLYRASTGWRCTPIWDWSADDVWALIAGWGLPYSPVYDRLTAIGIPRKQQRVGPLPLARREHLADGWPGLLRDLEARYGARWR